MSSIFDSQPAIHSVPSGSSNTPIYTWTDKYFKDTILKLKKLSYTEPSHTHSITYCVTALEFLYGGKSPMKFNIDDLYFAPLLIESAQEARELMHKTAFSKEANAANMLPSSTGTYDLKALGWKNYKIPIAEQQVAVRTVNVDVTTKDASQIDDETSKKGKQEPITSRSQLQRGRTLMASVEDIAKIQNYISEQLEDESKEELVLAEKKTATEKFIINLTAYIMSLMLRSKAKSKDSVLNSFNSRATENFKKIYGYEFDFIIPPPHKDIFDKLYQIGNLGAAKIWTHVSVCLLESYQDKQNNKLTQDIGLMRALFLLHWDYHGMGTLDLLKQAAESSNIPEIAIVKSLAAGRTLESAKNIFIRVYMNGGFVNEGQLTFPYCRIIDNQQFSDMSIKNNKILSSRLAQFLTKGNPDIFNATAFRDLTEEDKDDAKLWYVTFIAELSSLNILGVDDSTAQAIAIERKMRMNTARGALTQDPFGDFPSSKR